MINSYGEGLLNNLNISEHKAEKRVPKKEVSREIESSTLIDYRVTGSASEFLIKEVRIITLWQHICAST